MGNDVDMWEMAKICWKWLKYFGKGFDIQGTASVFEKRHQYVENDLNIF